jgi:hypothetical protein
VHNARAINLDRFPRELQPIVQPIDDWNRNYKLGLVLEARVGAGRLLVCSIDIVDNLATRPVARQLRRSLLDYMAGDRFRPAVELSADAFDTVLFDTRIMHKLGAVAEAPGRSAASAIDGDPNTFWMSGRPRPDGRGRPEREFDPASRPGHPHAITVRFARPVAMTGLVLMPRQNHREHIGDIREYAVAVSDDGATWRDLRRGELHSSFDPQTITFGETVTARMLRLTAVSGFGPDPTTALAELAIVYAGPPLDDADGGIDYQRAESATPEMEEGGAVRNRNSGGG